uniref:Uncharacterized protein n=1 Tax=Arundo donax TaxID=35708 RepID=A0A0A9CF15_ARUDO
MASAFPKATSQKPSAKSCFWKCRSPDKQALGILTNDY